MPAPREDLVQALRPRLDAVRRRIAAAARGREVRLVAVSKNQPAVAIRAAHVLGLRDFGENYVQELVAKARDLADHEDLRWHAIGPIQRNKAKSVAGIASMVHTIDRVELARELDRRAAAIGRRIDVLIEVNIGGEAQKAGCAPETLGALLDDVRALPALAVLGLMTIPPALDDPASARPFFARLRDLRDRHGGIAALPELSMGMSGDFEVAVEEGATIVRVGTAIFGHRPGPAAAR